MEAVSSTQKEHEDILALSSTQKSRTDTANYSNSDLNTILSRRIDPN